jgi:flagellar M-ring protein FliF
VNLQSLIARLRSVGSTLSGVQLATLAVTFVAVVGLVVGSAYWINAPTYAVLFADMDPESAGGVVTRLKNDKVPFVLDDGGRTIRVLASRVDELRLDFASQGMPTSGRIGFEIFDRTAFGVTDFLEQVNYRRALEGELARTIGTIAEVGSARVHIAMPRQSLFAGRDEATKASVVLKLRSNRALPASTVTAITGLVAASVEGLRPEGVVILDNFGRPLTRAAGGSDDATSGFQVERQQRIEHELSSRIVSLLEPIVGAERVRVNVTAKLNADSQEETEERWDPTPVVRSHQSVVQGSTAPGAAAMAAGVRSNLPPSADQAPKASASPSQTPSSPAAAQSTHSSEMTNYEVGRLTRHRVQPQGQIARLSVAVLLDDDRPTGPSGPAKPRAAPELQKIHDVVAAAVGLDAERGDQLTVENIAFEEAPAEEGQQAAPSWWRRYAPLLLDIGRIVAVLLIATLVVFGVVRPAVRQALSAAVVAPRALATPRLPRTVADMEGDLEAELDEGQEPSPQRRLPVLSRRVAKLAQQEPENAARLVRSWLAEEEH